MTHTEFLKLNNHLREIQHYLFLIELVLVAILITVSIKK